MFLDLKHKNLDIYKCSKQMAIMCFDVIKSFPEEQRYALVSQIRRAALSVVLNIAEGSARKSASERKRFYEIARSSLVELDAGLDVANDSDIMRHHKLDDLGNLIIRTYQMLTKMIYTAEV